MIEFDCKQCGTRLRTGDGTSGLDVTCPRCSTRQLVPVMSDTSRRVVEVGGDAAGHDVAGPLPPGPVDAGVRGGLSRPGVFGNAGLWSAVAMAGFWLIAVVGVIAAATVTSQTRSGLVGVSMIVSYAAGAVVWAGFFTLVADVVRIRSAMEGGVRVSVSENPGEGE